MVSHDPSAACFARVSERRAWRSTIFSLCLLSACYGPNPSYLGPAAEGEATDSDPSATNSEGGSGSESSEGVESTTSTSGESGESESGGETGMGSSTQSESGGATETETETETGGETDAPAPSCGDGNVDAGEFCFEYAQLSMTPEVHALAAADFDDDGNADLAIGAKNEVLVLFGDGLGGFGLQTDLPEPDGDFRGAGAGDLDGDERPDLIVSHLSGDQLLVYPSLGGGDFGPPLGVDVGDQPRELELALLDDDPHLDVLVAIANDDAVAVLLGDGAGGFAPAQLVSTASDNPVSLQLGLLDGDGLLDLLVANASGEELSVLRGAPFAQFGPAQLFPLSGKPSSARLADFNLDGELDVAATLEDTDMLAVLLGDGAGGLLLPAQELALGLKPSGAAISDLDSDGAPDLVVINTDSEDVTAVRNSADDPGQLSTQTLVWFNGFTRLSAIIAADLDDDGVQDIIVGGDGVKAMLSNP